MFCFIVATFGSESLREKRGTFSFTLNFIIANKNIVLTEGTDPKVTIVY